MTRISNVTRRRLLTALGLSAGSCFLPSLFGHGVAAQSFAPPRRVVFFLTLHGPVRENWWMRREHPEYSSFEYPFDDPDPASFSTILRALHPRRKDLMVLEGLAMTSALADAAINRHYAAHAHLLCASPMVPYDDAGGPSVDQVIARKVAVGGRLPSLELCTEANPWQGGFVNAGPGQRLPVESDMGRLFDRLFPRGEKPPSEPTERDKIKNAHLSVLDLVGDEYAAVLPRVSGEDKRKLELHRDLVRGWEARLEKLGTSSCAVPEAPFAALRNAKVRPFADLTAAALACDLTRVVTIQARQLENDEFGAPPGDVHESFAHQTDTDPNAALQMTRYNQVHAEQFLYLVEALARYPEGNGTLLDHTAVVWMTELANGPHELDKIAVVIAGGCGGAFKTGRYISFAQDRPNPHHHPEWHDETRRPIGPAHSHLLVSLMRAMGLEDNAIGMTQATTHDGSGRTIDLTGALPRLGS